MPGGGQAWAGFDGRVLAAAADQISRDIANANSGGVMQRRGNMGFLGAGQWPASSWQQQGGPTGLRPGAPSGFPSYVSGKHNSVPGYKYSIRDLPAECDATMLRSWVASAGITRDLVDLHVWAATASGTKQCVLTYSTMEACSYAGTVCWQWYVPKRPDAYDPSTYKYLGGKFFSDRRG